MRKAVPVPKMQMLVLNAVFLALLIIHKKHASESPDFQTIRAYKGRLARATA